MSDTPLKTVVELLCELFHQSRSRLYWSDLASVDVYGVELQYT